MRFIFQVAYDLCTNPSGFREYLSACMRINHRVLTYLPLDTPNHLESLVFFWDVGVSAAHDSFISYRLSPVFLAQPAEAKHVASERSRYTTGRAPCRP